jgi:DNA-binding response OmpR family regulator/serine/threonine protein kinase
MTRVLIVEDNLDLANVVRSMLEFDSYAVDVFHTGAAGLQNILANSYDLVILDWDLPDVSGLQILTQFRARGAQTPVIMLTGRNAVEDKEAGLDGGADDYLTKPFSMKELGARVRAQLRRSTVAVAGYLNLGNISLDCANQRVAKDGRSHMLPSQEFQLLEYAAKYPHLQPTGEDLVRLLWPEDGDEGPQKLRMAIRRLRKKFDPQGQVIFAHLFPELTANPLNKLTDSTAEQTDLDADPFVGTIFSGKYELTELIGGGGSGLVYQAKHIVLDNSLAVKVLHVNVVSQLDMVRRFQREAKISALLSHPNIVAVRDFGLAEQGAPYLVMELVDGAGLDEVLGMHGLPPAVVALDIFQQVCAGLDHAHKKGLVHRDLKPSNLMLTIGGNSDILVKIVDFGLARSAAEEHGLAKITQTGHVFGSPPYMSPEQCRGQQLDQRSDIYSVGCALYETLQGQPPFSGEDAVSILIKHVSDEPANILRDDVPPHLLAERYQSTNELMVDLGRALKDFGQTEQKPPPINFAPPGECGSWIERKKAILESLGQSFKPSSKHLNPRQ